MITAKMKQKAKPIEINLSSDKHSNTMRVLVWSDKTATGTYSNNGMKLNRDSYHSLLQHLRSKGW